MPFAAISDVHGNLDALKAVLKDIKRRGIKTVRFLGDAVGYGPDPNACVSLLMENSETLIAGNHDRGAVGLADTEGFNPHAKAAIKWTADVLTDENREAIKGFLTMKSIDEEDILLVHSTPFEPEKWHYLLSLHDAVLNFGHFREKTCLLGHSHIPFIAERLSDGGIAVHKESASLGTEGRYIINSGSVGQPRDGDPRACYLIIEGCNASLLRVAYDVGITQRKMAKAGLPKPLIDRLSLGA